MIIAIIATAAALVSATMAFFSWFYNKELSKAKISLIDVKVEGKREDVDKLKINLIFIFKNIGKETLKINELTLAHVEYKNKKFEQFKKKTILNPIHPESVFNYSTFFIIKINPNLPNEQIGQILPQITGKHVIIIRLRYKSITLFSMKEILIKYFLGYEGYGIVYQLNEDEYNEIREILPEEFKIN